MVSSRSLVVALMRLHSVRELGIKLPVAARIPATRVAALARFAGAAKVSAILRLPNPRRLATLVAFVHCLEASAQDDALEVLEVLLRELFGDAIKADKKARLRSLKGTGSSGCDPGHRLPDAAGHQLAGCRSARQTIREDSTRHAHVGVRRCQCPGSTR